MSSVDTPEETAVAAGLDRRFYAFVIDRIIAWGLFVLAAVGGWLISGDALVTVLVTLAVVVVVSLMWAMMVGLAGITPGKAAVGLRVVRRETGGPLGFGRALLRQLILGVAGLPVFGLGIGMLAWTAVMDGSGLRRGWHDLVSHSAVVDVRPPQVTSIDEVAPPKRIVNLTAMRLMPVPSAPEVSTPLPPPPAPSVVADAEPAWRQEPASEPAPAWREQEPEPEPVPEPPAVPEPEPYSPPVPPAPAAPARPAPEPTAPEQPAVEPPAPEPAPRETPEQPSQPTAPQPVAPAPYVPSPPTAPTQIPVPPPGRHQAAPAAPAGPAIRWQVSFDTGESFVVEGLALVGRKPEARAGEPVAHLVALPSSDMSLSKTHAQFQVAPDGALVVMDRGSTNGSVLIRAGISRPLGSRKPATLREGDRVRFGDREMSVARA